jgi:hypothetical protein
MFVVRTILVVRIVLLVARLLFVFILWLLLVQRVSIQNSPV